MALSHQVSLVILTFPYCWQVSKDDRSDIESSSEEETEITKGKTVPSPKGENGTNGHSVTAAWAQDHGSWGEQWGRAHTSLPADPWTKHLLLHLGASLYSRQSWTSLNTLNL